MPSRIKLRPRSTPPTPGPDSETLFLDEADGVLKSIDSEGVVTAVEGAGGGAAEPGTVSVYAQDTDPGAVGAGSIWVDLTGGDPYQIKIRNAVDGGWEHFILEAKDGLGVEVASVDVGPGDGSGVAGLFAGPPGAQVIATVAGDGTIILSSGDTEVFIDNLGSVKVNTADGNSRFLIQADGLVRLENSAFAQFVLLANGDVQMAGPNIEFLPDVSLKSNGSIIGTQAAAVADVVDPATATPEDVANTVNALLASLRASAELAT